MNESNRAARQGLRQRLRSQRKALSWEEAREKSLQIQKNLLQSNIFQQALSVFSYVAAIDQEVDTRMFLEQALADGKQVYVPYLEAPKHPMQVGRISSLDDLQPGLWGIPQAPLPAGKTPDLDCLLIPGVGFDCHGNRLGLGGGYFDRWLQHRAGVRIGLAYAFQLVNGIPTESWDEPVHWIVTEKGLHPAL